MKFSYLPGIFILLKCFLTYGEVLEYSADFEDSTTDTDFMIPSTEEVTMETDEFISENCSICTITVNRIQRTLKKSLSLKNVQKIVLGLCETLKAKSRNQCVKFFKNDGVKVLAGLISSKPSLKICKTLNMCLRSEENLEYLEVFNLLSSQQESQRAVDDCKLCRHHVSRIERHINRAITPEFIKNKLWKVCSLFTLSTRVKCMFFMRFRAIKVIKAVQQQEKPRKICAMCFICKRYDLYQDLTNEIDTEVDLHQDLCSVCRRMIYNLTKKANSNTSKEKIINYLFETCSKLPIFEKFKCWYIYRLYSTNIANLIRLNIYPEKICSILQICTTIGEGYYSSDGGVENFRIL